MPIAERNGPPTFYANANRASLAWPETIIHYRMRGIIWPKKEGGTVRLAFAPSATLILFLKANQPVAIATIDPKVKVIERDHIYEITYKDIKWLTTKEPKG